MNIELKPCPFCGGTNLELSTKTVTISYEKRRHIAVYCKKCHTYGPRLLVENKKYKIDTSLLDCIKAEEMWNKRCN